MTSPNTPLSHETTQPTITPQLSMFVVLVHSDADMAKPTRIVGWDILHYDEGTEPPSYKTPEGYKSFYLPDMTQEQWDDIQYNQNGLGGCAAYFEGKIIPFTPTPYIPPLKDQAQTSLQAVQQQASMIAAMGESFGPKMRDYVQVLRAIINGSDTTNTVLPTAPSDPTQ